MCVKQAMVTCGVDTNKSSVSEGKLGENVSESKTRNAGRESLFKLDEVVNTIVKKEKVPFSCVLPPKIVFVKSTTNGGWSNKLFNAGKNAFPSSGRRWNSWS